MSVPSREGDRDGAGSPARPRRGDPARDARRRQRRGILVGTSIAAALLAVLLMPEQARLHVRGPMNVGHDTVSCGWCHQPASGTTRQQLQANTRAALGLREEPVPFGHLPVSNANCLACHTRPNERHPVFRFLEPRFREARQEIAPQNCVSCHTEHTGERVTASETFCSSCHSDLSMRNDPLDVPHVRLVAEQRWATCLGCHSYHGNHLTEEPVTLEDTISVRRLREYFRGLADSPYSDAVRYPARAPETRR